MSFKDKIAVTLSVIVLCWSTITVGQLGLFLSSHSPLQLSRNSLVANIGKSDSPWSKAAVDVCLVALFVLQHSFQNCRAFKEFLSGHGCGVFERLLYNMGSCFTLQVLMSLWQPIPSWVVWEIPTSSRPLVWWAFCLVHGVGWLLIYSGCYIMDMRELLGINQVVYSVQGQPDPLSFKSEGLRRFYSHMRHPSFSAFSVILLVHPLMHVDRLILAHLFVGYTVCRTRVDDIDYAYQKRLLLRKERDLNCNE